MKDFFLIRPKYCSVVEITTLRSKNFHFPKEMFDELINSSPEFREMLAAHKAAGGPFNPEYWWPNRNNNTSENNINNLTQILPEGEGAKESQTPDPKQDGEEQKLELAAQEEQEKEKQDLQDLNQNTGKKRRRRRKKKAVTAILSALIPDNTLPTQSSSNIDPNIHPSSQILEIETPVADQINAEQTTQITSSSFFKIKEEEKETIPDNANILNRDLSEKKNSHLPNISENINISQAITIRPESESTNPNSINNLIADIAQSHRPPSGQTFLFKSDPSTPLPTPETIENIALDNSPTCPVQSTNSSYPYGSTVLPDILRPGLNPIKIEIPNLLPKTYRQANVMNLNTYQELLYSRRIEPKFFVQNYNNRENFVTLHPNYLDLLKKQIKNFSENTSSFFFPKKRDFIFFDNENNLDTKVAGSVVIISALCISLALTISFFIGTFK